MILSLSTPELPRIGPCAESKCHLVGVDFSIDGLYTVLVVALDCT